ncbi:GNAT family N-acetyltransferase [Halobacterium bonnevillei]|uniref:GNAT family N-acetyltransferase n=1 Tax=Halobacterium bonnevillei TaxID=2692200 RepID=A0A6B0SMP6_9EURY|nr:GNAT family N-acetyltransferase [Halobacterium bonnevillei]MXR20242.1 GNAT family N-acetyltransferase [Halobacterium bonnevillei]
MAESPPRSDRPLYVLWPDGLRPPDVRVPDEYALRTSRREDHDREAVAALLDSHRDTAGGERVDALRDYVLPNGWFVAVERATNAVVGTAAAIHDPRDEVGTRRANQPPPGETHYFPFGGAVASLFVAPEHRREGLGCALCAAATRRLLDTSYDSVRVSVAHENRAALALFLHAGFAPGLLTSDDVGRWRDVFDVLGLPFDAERCVRVDRET